MSQVTVTTTTPPVTVVYSRATLITMTVMLAVTSEHQMTLGQHDVVLLPQLILKHTVRGSGGHTTMLQQQKPLCQMPSQTYANYAIGPLQVSFSFRFEPPTDSIYHMLVSVMVFAFHFQIPVSLKCSLMEALLLGFAPSHLLNIPLASIYVSRWWSVIHTRSTLSGCSSHYFEWGRASYCLFSCHPAIPSIWLGIQLRGLGRESPNPPAFPTWWRALLYPDSALPDDMVSSESVVGIKLGNSGVVIEYQVDKLTCTWLAEHFITSSHIYPGFLGFHINQLPIQMRLWEVVLYGLDSWELWACSWFYPNRLCWHTRTGCIFWQGWCHALFRLFTLSVLS